MTGLNVVGLRRAGFSRESIDALRQFYRVVYREGRPLSAALDRIEADFGHVPEVVEIHLLRAADEDGYQPGSVH